MLLFSPSISACLRRALIVTAMLWIQIAPAEAQDYREADNFCAQAFEDVDVTRAGTLLGKCRQELLYIENSLPSNSPELSVLSARYSILESLVRATKIDEKRDQIDLLRLLPRVLRLVKELSSFSDHNNARGRHNLGRLKRSIWAPSAAHIGRQCNRADFKDSGIQRRRGDAPSDLFDGGKRRVSVLELIGEPALMLAKWRKGSPLVVNKGTSIALTSLAEKGRMAKRGAISPQFVLLLHGSFSRIGYKEEVDLADQMNSLLSNGILPAVTSELSRSRPFTLIPQFAGSPPTSSRGPKIVVALCSSL